VWRPLLLLSLVCTCYPLFDNSHCPPSTDFTPGKYVSTGGKWGGDKGSYPHAEAGSKTLVLERGPDRKARLSISYSRGGKAIVESWTNDSSDGEIPWDPRVWGPGMLRLKPAEFDFGAVQIGQSRSEVFRVENVGTGTAGLLMSSGTGDGFEFEPIGCPALNPGASCMIRVTFRPTTAGVSAGVLTAKAGIGWGVMAHMTGVGVSRDAAPAEPDAAPDAAPPPDDAGGEDGSGPTGDTASGD
jgi:hypothetical protein